MSSALPQLDQLVRELGDVCALPESEGEPSLTAATMAVTKATTALAHAALARGRGAALAVAQALQAVEEAREAVQTARAAIAASAARRGHRPRAAEGPPAGASPSSMEATVEGAVEATCLACGHALVVRYRALMPTPVVVFPVACPFGRCDGVSEVEYPATAVDVTVEPGEA